MSYATPQPAPVVDYRSLPGRLRGSWFNVRIVVFTIVFGVLIGAPLYIYLDQALSHGVKQRADGVVEVNLKSMSVFPFDQNYGKIEDVPEIYRALDGKKVVLIGEMWAPDAASAQIDKFDLVYSIAKCCFSGPPQIQHFVKSTAVAGQLPFYSGPVRVTGTLKVNVTTEAGKVSGVYHLAVENVEPV
jgi:hypothetical protein